MGFSGMTDRDLWNSFINGDDQAVAVMYSEYSKNLYRYGIKFTSDAELVEDTIQELFAELIRCRENLGTTDNILFYLLRSFKRMLHRKLEKEKRLDHPGNFDHLPFNITYSIEHQLIVEEDSQMKARMLHQALHALTPRQKEAVYLRYSMELDYPSISGIMHISLKACRNLVSGSMKILKEAVRDRQSTGIIFFIDFLKKV
jgi:RNA polymerase sigma factor (sigma-70 family)